MLFWPYLGKIRASMAHVQNWVQFFTGNNKGSHYFPRTFYFIKIFWKFWLKVKIFCLVWYFAAKMGHVWLKQLWCQMLLFWGQEISIILFCTLQQRYFDLNLKNKFLKSLIFYLNPGHSHFLRTCTWYCV